MFEFLLFHSGIVPESRGQTSVWTYHNNNARTGLNANETILTPVNVNPATFGRVFTCAVDSDVFAQPLYLPNITVPGLGTYNVLYVATEADTVYAFDADNGGFPLWQTSFLNPAGGVTNVWPNDLLIPPPMPELGITATPVIDTNSLTVYVLAETKENGVLMYRLHALDATTGRDLGNVIIEASVAGAGDAANSLGRVVFDPVYHLGRPGLALVNGVVYLSFGSLNDIEPCHGWLLGYDAGSLAQLSAFCTTPNGGLGSIWMSGAAPAADQDGKLFIVTGNGDFSTNSSATTQFDYGDAVIKLTANNGLAVADYFVPFNQASLAAVDLDLGSGAPVMLPDEVGSSAHPHLLTCASKAGTIYLVDRDQLGGYDATADQIVQELPGLLGGMFGSGAYFNHHVYYRGAGTALSAFQISDGTLGSKPDSQSLDNFSYTSCNMSISADGTNNGIVWEIQSEANFTAPYILHAYDAADLTQELYASTQSGQRDVAPICTKFTLPTIANGKVYVAGSYSVAAYGLASFVAAPFITPGGGRFTNTVTVTLSCPTPGAQIHYTLDNSAPTLTSLLYSGPFVLTNSGNVTIQAQAFVYGTVPSVVASVKFFNTRVLQPQTIGVDFNGGYVNSNDALGLAPTDVAGVVPQPNWNNEPGGQGGPAFLIDQTGQPTQVTLTWDSSGSPAWGTASGAANPDYQLFSGYIESWGSDRVSVSFANLQPGLYKLLAYTLCDLPGSDAQYTVNGDTNNSFFVTCDGPAFAGVFLQCANTNPSFYALGNYIEFDNLQPTNGTLTLEGVVVNYQAPINGVQLIQTHPAPSVSVTAPADGAFFVADAASILLSTTASDQDAIEPVVSLFVGTNLLANLPSQPYNFTWTGVPPGQYTLTAQVTDMEGLTTTSAPVNLTVQASMSGAYGVTNLPAPPAYLNMPKSASGPIPSLLSLTGAFADIQNLGATNGLIPYDVNVPLWSDGAIKTRWISIPVDPFRGTGPIMFNPTGPWGFPSGTVFVKNFSLNTDQTNPNVLRRLETRLLVVARDGGVYGATYKWRPDNTDADLLTNSLLENIMITNSTGVSTQTWYYPSRADCLTCHTPAAGYALGVNTRQLNRSLTYSSSGVTDNQLRTLNRLGLFNPPLTDETEITNLARLSALTNASAILEDRARSYLDANCAQCHQPGGAHANFDARWDTPLVNQNIINGPVSANLGFDRAAVVVPKDIWRSMLYQRMNSSDPRVMMPPLAHNLVDTNAVQVFADWIDSLIGTRPVPPPKITPGGGSSVLPITVTLQDSDNQASLYYTLDSTFPTTNSASYSGPLSLNASATLTVKAFRDGFADSIPVQALFTISAATPFNLVGLIQAAEGEFQIEIQGTPGQTYVLQSSSDLFNWVPILTNVAPANFFGVAVPAVSSAPAQFFRVVQTP